MAQTEPEENLGNMGATVIWDDNDNELGLRPSSIIVYCLEKGTDNVVNEPMVINSSSNWEIALWNIDVEDYDWGVQTIEHYTGSVNTVGSSLEITYTLINDDPDPNENPSGNNESDENGDDSEENIKRTEYYINITDKPLENVNNINFKLSKTVGDNGDIIDNISIISKSQFTDLMTEWESIKQNYITDCYQMLNGTISAIMEQSDYQFSYASKSGGLKQGNETLTFNQIKEAVEGNPNAQTKYYQHIGNPTLAMQSWDTWGVVRIPEINLNNIRAVKSDDTGGFVFDMNNAIETLLFNGNTISDGCIELSLNDNMSDRNVYVNKNRNTVVHKRLEDKLTTEWKKYDLNEDDYLYVYLDWEGMPDNSVIDIKYKWDYIIRINSIIDKAYPIDSIYITTSDDDPNELFGGVWNRISEGRTLVGSGTGKDTNGTDMTFNANTTGGEYNHILTRNEMPSHNHKSPAHRHYVNKHFHSIPSHTHAMGNIYSKGTGKDGAYTFQANREKTQRYTAGSGTLYTSEKDLYTDNSTISIGNEGGGEGHYNVPPYFVVNIWKRIY